MRSMIVDTESNGMKPEQICQLSYIIADNGELTAKNFFFSVSCMNEYAQKKHGLSKHRLYTLSSGRLFSERFMEFQSDFYDIDLICGHNIGSDTRLLSLCFLDSGCSFPKIREFDTMRHFDNALHLKSRTGQHKYPNLGELCGYYRIKDEQIQEFCSEMFGKSALKAHDSRYDTAATCLCIIEGQRRGDLKGVI